MKEHVSMFILDDRVYYMKEIQHSANIEQQATQRIRYVFVYEYTYNNIFYVMVAQ